MFTIDHRADPRAWAEEQFGDAPFSDVRRGERLVTIGAAMAANPGASIPLMFRRRYDTKAAYTFFGHAEADPDTIQAEHRALVIEAMDGPQTHLLIEDTTELDWSSRDPIPGLGPIGNSNTKTQGVHLHTVLGLRWPTPAIASPDGRRPGVELLGVCDQQYHLRTPRPEGEARDNSCARKKRERESQIWERASGRIGPAPRGSRWIRVGDAGADIYEHMLACRDVDHGFLIRSGQDRALAAPSGRAKIGMLYATARALEALGEFEIEIPARKGQPARTATLRVSAAAVRLRAPQRPGAGAGTLPAVECSLVRVWEEKARDGVEALEWILLTDTEVETFEQAREIALQYSTRWIVEDYHKGLKTGLGAERLQLETAERLFAVVAVMSVVAVRLVSLREQMRRDPDQPAERSGFDALTLETLRVLSDKPVTTVRDVAMAIGRLGGHLNRKRDGMPGWQTLWRGMHTLDLLVEGVRLSHRVKRFGE